MERPISRRLPSLRFRLILGAAAAILIALAGTGIALVLLFERHVERRIVAELAADLAQLIAGLSLENSALRIDPPPADPRFAAPLSGYYWQVDQSGSAPLRSRSLWERRLPPLEAGRSSAETFAITLGGEQLVALSREVIVASPARSEPLRATVAISRDEVDEAVDAFTVDLAPALAVLAAILFLASLVQIQIGLRPLARIRMAVAEIATGVRRRLGESGPVEVVPLALAIDNLLESQEEALRKAKTRSSDLAHGLKTPLQALLGMAGRLRPSDPDTALEIELVSSTLRARVERALALSRAETRALSPVRTSVAAVADDVIRVAARTPAGMQLDLTVEGDADAAVDPADLAELLGTLVENAVRFARREIAIRIEREADMVRIQVADDGPGIPASYRQAVLARGTRLDETNPGDGLGLSIAAEIASAYGGSLVLQDAAPGLCAELRLPAVRLPLDAASF